uniref:Tudor domain-containing protein 7B n=1 Tax=Neogobius melanostomus TaxID=47308 RepID=A0A8C6STI8_9GOBI
MADPELVKKMLGAILQAQRSGLSAARLQSEYRELTGDAIPLTQMGHSSLSALLDSLPTTVRAENTASGEVLYFVSGAGEKRNMAKVVARQRSSKKTGRAHLVNTEMRVKPDNPLVIHGEGQCFFLPAPMNVADRRQPYSSQLVQGRLREILAKYSNGFWVSKLPQIYRELYKEELHPMVLRQLNTWTHICTVERTSCSSPSELLLYPAEEQSTSPDSDSPTPQPSSPAPQQQSPASSPSPTSSHSPSSSSPAALSPELQVKLEELLLKYPNGLWAHALPKLYQDTYKVCTVPTFTYTSQLAQYYLVRLVALELFSCPALAHRYIGEGYNQAQERMEDEMRRFYGPDQNSTMSPQLDQLVAVRAVEEEVLRAQVCQLLQEKVKVYYVDYGFSEVISKTKVYDLNERFYILPFQATKCKLAGLEPFCQEPAVLKTFERMASGKILLAEMLERGERPLVVLYDTSQDDDVNINTACVRAMMDRSLASPLQVDSVYMGATVTSVSSDGSLYCQLPSRGLLKLKNILDNIETHFQSQVTSEYLVSLPFCGKGCLARYKGKWARVEITNLHGSRVLDILFIDLGAQASVEVFELREIPQAFLRDLLIIPAQAVKCCLSDLSVSVGSWTPEAVHWLRERALHLTDCSIKVAKVDETNGCVHVHLFTDKNFHDATRSLNHQMAQSQLFKRHPDVFLTSLRSAVYSRTAVLHCFDCLLPGHNLDVYVSVACHPGYFVLQPWRDMYKLVVLMGEMILFYSKTEEQQLSVAKGQVYAAKVDNNWYRVLVKGVLSNGLVSVYELDYGKHEVVSSTQLRSLVPDFTRLPFQALTAQLAGVKQRQWSEEASIVFRNHVERKALVAQLDALQEAPEPWERRLTVFLVDTSQDEKDVWVHDIMADLNKVVVNG